MSVGIEETILNGWLDGLCATVWVELHTGDPGVDGTGSPATETTRQQATFNSAAAGSADTSGDLVWLSVAASETFSHASFWDDETAGTFLGSGRFSPSRAVIVGDDFTVAAGELVISIAPVAA